MNFDANTWKEKANSAYQGAAQFLKEIRDKGLPLATYSAVATMSIWPVVEAAVQTGQIFPVVGALYTLAGGVGANLLAEQLSRWKDRTEQTGQTPTLIEVRTWLAKTVAENTDLQETLDTIITNLNALPQIEAALPAADREWFAQTLRAELAQLGNAPHYEAVQWGGGSLVQGDHNVVAGEGGMALKGNVEGDLLMPGANKAVHPRPETEAEAKENTLQALKQRYLASLAHQCNILPLAALGQEEGGQSGEGQTLGLDDLYVDLDTTGRARLTEAEKKQEKYRSRAMGDERPLSALEVITQDKFVVILGDPGSGKSTFVRQVARKTAQLTLGQAPDGWHLAGFPLLITLRDLAARLRPLNLDGLSEAGQKQKLVAAIEDQWRADMTTLRAAGLGERLDEALSRETLLLIFDGLDEAPEDLRPRVRLAVQAATEAYPALERVIVTCRVRSYGGAAMLPTFKSHTLADFDRDKVRQFVAAWYTAQSRAIDQTRIDDQIRDLQSAALSNDLRELSANPMLLTTMAIIHQRDVGLPRERVRLYDKAIEILLNRWQRRKGQAASEALQDLLGDDRKLRLIMERLAYEAHQTQAGAGSEARMKRLEILGLLEERAYLGDISLANDFLNYVDQRAGILVGQGGGEGDDRPPTYDFPHRAFQEYLAGCYLVTGRSIHRTYWEKVAEGDYWYLAARLGAEELYFNRRNEQTLLDLAYALCPAAEPASPTDWRAALWSGHMAAILGAPAIRADAQKAGSDAAYLKRLIPRLVQTLTGHILGPIERSEAGQALAHLGDPRPGVGLLPDGLPDIEWCEVPAGAFLMGSEEQPRGWPVKETPQHQVTLPAYQISRYPVTNAQYAAFVQDGGYQNDSYWAEAQAQGYWQTGSFKGDLDDQPRSKPYDFGLPYTLANHPVVGVSWYEALAYCRWLTERLAASSAEQLRAAGLIEAGAVVRLPGEREWEKAARGTDGQTYPWGEEITPEHANYDQTGVGATSAVGCFPAGQSPFGCEDMAGNVWEWCQTKWQDSYEDYADDPSDDDNDNEGTARRVLRGGAFANSEDYVRCASRDRYSPNLRYMSIGFRLVLSPFTSGL